MRFVAVKSKEQQALLTIHRVRQLVVRQKTQMLNVIRGLLREFGHVIGLGHPDEAGQFVSAVMNSRSGDVDALTSDDRDGAAFLYASNEGAVAPRITLALVDQSPVEGDAVDFAVGVSGTAPFTYQWRRNGLVK